MNITPLTVDSSIFDNPDQNDDPLYDFFLGQSFDSNIIPDNPFAAGAYEYQEEAFNMQQLLDMNDLTGGVSPLPAFPNVLSLNMDEPLAKLNMYANNLRVLAAPAELCVQKALELIGSRALYEINVEAFRMELLNDEILNPGAEEINALVKGICCIAEYIMAYFDNAAQCDVDLFPYEYACLHMGKYLFLSKIVADASIPKFRPATVARPAYSYPEVQATVRADYFTQADQCLIF